MCEFVTIRVYNHAEFSGVDSMTEKREPSYPTLLLSQNKHRFYFSTIPVEDLFPNCFVARREEDSQKGFQRALSETRADDISKYLAAGDGSIPTNVVLSAQEEANIEYKPRSKTISFNRVPRAFLVLDGQHRLWGYAKCRIKHRVPVAIYEGLSRAEEAKLFIDINTNQRGVPAALLLDIKQLAEIESEKESLLRTFFDRLQNDPHSALNGKLSPAKSTPNRISRVAFNRSITAALNSEVVRSLETEDIYRLIRNYINAFEAELSEKSTLTKASYFEAIFEMFDEVVRATMTSQNNVKQSSVQDTIRVIAKLDFGGRGKLTKKGYTDLMQPAFRKGVALSADML
jgi:DGQHR domain-containing protein